MTARCRHCNAPAHTPRALQAIPLPSLQEATHRASCLPSVIVGAVILGIAFLEVVVPALAGAIASVLP